MSVSGTYRPPNAPNRSCGSCITGRHVECRDEACDRVAKRPHAIVILDARSASRHPDETSTTSGRERAIASRHVFRPQTAGEDDRFARAGAAPSSSQSQSPTGDATPVPPSAPATNASSSTPSPASIEFGERARQAVRRHATRPARCRPRNRAECGDSLGARVRRAAERRRGPSCSADARDLGRALIGEHADAPHRAAARRETPPRACSTVSIRGPPAKITPTYCAPSDTAYSASSARVSPQNLIVSAHEPLAWHAGKLADGGGGIGRRGDRPSRPGPRPRRERATRSTSARAADATLGDRDDRRAE